ncbi:hypothetical protein EDB87DRAFT_1614472 [Lactarius vividus]|nr:hypothetical protein EDB87DRAFT_1614472 [Lactarius vividus]
MLMYLESSTHFWLCGRLILSPACIASLPTTPAHAGALFSPSVPWMLSVFGRWQGSPQRAALAWATSFAPTERRTQGAKCERRSPKLAPSCSPALDSPASDSLP